jgi:hypothetical protein
MKLFLLALCALTITGCPTPSPIPPDPDVWGDVYIPPPEPFIVVDAGTDPVKDATPAKDAASPVGDIFDKACANLVTLRCKEGFSAPPQDSCADALRHAQKIANMKPDCVAAAGSVAAVKKCGRYCQHLQP